MNMVALDARNMMSQSAIRSEERKCEYRTYDEVLIQPHHIVVIRISTHNFVAYRCYWQ